MFCVILGLVPPSLSFWDSLQEHLTSVAEHGVIDWIEYSTAIDTDNDDTTTLLVSAWTRVPPDTVCAAVQEHLSASPVEPLISCELWASAPAPLTLRPKEGYRVKYNGDKDDNVNQASATMKEWGICIQPSVLDTNALTLIRQLVDEEIRQTQDKLQSHHPTLRIGQDDMLFQEIASRNLQRFDLRLSHKSATDFVHDHILTQESVTALLQETMECTRQEMDFDVSVVYSKPGACAQHWHADGAHQKGATDAGWTRQGHFTQLAPPYAICLFLPLIDLNETVGYTQFWPGSHRYRDLVGFGPVATLAGATLDEGMHCSAGDGIWYDYRLLHRGMPNTSTDTVRPILQVVFKKKWYVERANYGTTSIMASKTAEELPPKEETL